MDAKQMNSQDFEKYLQLAKEYVNAKTSEERKKIGHQLDKLKGGSENMDHHHIAMSYSYKRRKKNLKRKKANNE